VQVGSETLGLPPGLQIPQLTLAGLLGIPEPPGFVFDALAQCGDFLCDANGQPDLTKPNPIGLQEDVSAELLGALAATTALRADVFLNQVAGQTGQKLFSRGTGLLNTNDYLRIGYGWEGSARTGANVFRIAIGSKRLPFHWHFTLWRF